MKAVLWSSLLFLAVCSGGCGPGRIPSNGSQPDEGTTSSQPSEPAAPPSPAEIETAPATVEPPAARQPDRSRTQTPEVETGGVEAAQRPSGQPDGEPVGPPAQPEDETPGFPPASAFHEKCGVVLNSNFIRNNGRVNYKLLNRKRLVLKQLLDEFDRLDRRRYESWDDSDKIAFWINAYNLQLLNIIVDNYPIRSSRILRIIWGPNSIRHIKGIWEDYKFMIMDEEFTLSAIEYRYFRRRFEDPRIFLALCNASVSSPPLYDKPYRGAKLDDQLDDQVSRFIAGGRAIVIDRRAAVVRLSAIFQPNWFGSEFVERYGIDRKFKSENAATRAVLNFLSHYLPPRDIEYLEVGNYSVEYLTYDWDLNE